MAERFGRYTVIEELGVGGMASVHLARTDDGRRIALKRLLPHSTTEPETVRAFLDEARLVVHLDHPNIAKTYDCGKIEGTYFIAMEYVAGHTLAQLIARCATMIGVIPFPITVNILIQLCDALDYAHKRCDEHGKPLHIIHRDVSPANVILSSTGIVKLIDFGIAKATSSTVHSQVGVVKGKFGYMAPEYLKGKLDWRVDLWALGALAHELLTNRPLFTGPDEFNTLYNVRFQDIEPPSHSNPDVPADFDVIVMTALQREPDRRWQSAAAMRTALANAAAELQTIVTNAQLIEWVEWTFTQAPLREGSELSQLIKLLDSPSRPSRSRLSDVLLVERVPAPEPLPAPARDASASQPGRAKSAAESDREATEVATLRAGLPRPASSTHVATRPSPVRPVAPRSSYALRVLLLLLLLLGASAYAAWHHGYIDVDVPYEIDWSAVTAPAPGA